MKSISILLYLSAGYDGAVLIGDYIYVSTETQQTFETNRRFARAWEFHF